MCILPAAPRAAAAQLASISKCDCYGCPARVVLLGIVLNMSMCLLWCVLQRRVRAASLDAAATAAKPEKGRGKGKGKQAADGDNQAR